MAEFDFAIHGSDLFSGLLAGVLARDYGKKVIRIGRRRSPQRLWRSLPLALPLATRPASWELLDRGVTDTATLLRSMGLPDALSTSEVALTADTAASAMALDHLIHVALGNGHQLRRLEQGWSLRRVAIADHDTIAARLPDWLAAAGVASADEAPADAALTVLAEDTALLDGLDEAQRPAILAPQPMMTTLIVASRALAVPIQIFPDRGVTLVAQPGNTIVAFVSGDDDADARLASTLPGPFPMKRLASTRYRSVVSIDGAPVIGRVKGTKQIVIAGLGNCAPFLASTIARHLAGQADGAVKAWFAAHDPSRPRAPVAEFVPVTGTAA